jgi:hypothetical protein
MKLADMLAEAMRNGHPDDGGDLDHAVYQDAERYTDYLHNAGYTLVACTFEGLVGITRELLDYHYPEEAFGGQSLDSGAQFVRKLREALAMVHAGTPASTRKEQS